MTFKVTTVQNGANACLGFVKEYIGGPLSIYIPYSKDKREKILNEVREKVALYLPKIEGKTGVKLAEVPVKEQSEFFKDVAKEVETELTEGKKLTSYEKALNRAFSVIATNIVRVPMEAYSSLFSSAAAGYYRGSIYIPFYLINRFNNWTHGERNTVSGLNVDEVVVHELSHHLWSTLENKSNKLPGVRKWNEGFATYCEQEEFKEFYPESKFSLGVNDFNKKQKSLVEKVIQTHGKKVLLEIPTRWPEFDKEFKIN